jgi:hypothetical protein
MASAPHATDSTIGSCSRRIDATMAQMWPVASSSAVAPRGGWPRSYSIFTENYRQEILQNMLEDGEGSIDRAAIGKWFFPGTLALKK